MAGRSWSRSFAICGAALLSLYVIAGCNSILGIEPAELDETIGLAQCPQQLHQVPPKTDCETCSEDDQGICGLAACLSDHDCRMGLRQYRNCLGPKCQDQGATCQACVDNKQALTLIKCLAGRACSAGAPTTPCEEYCSCMIQQCPNTVPDADPGGFEGCLNACQNGASVAWQGKLNDPVLAATWQKAQPSWRPYCLWEHCELAADPLGKSHCGHAVGKANWCVNQPKEDTTTMSCPPGKNYGGFACNYDTDCCSGHCKRDLLSCED